MGLLDDVLGAVQGAQGQAGAGGGLAGGGLLGSVISMLGSGGLEGIVNALQSSGLGDVVKSWIGTGANLPISAQQIQQALGGHVGQLAQQHGMSADAVSSQLSQILPGLVDKLTPSGQLPQGGGLEQALSGLQGMLGGR